MKQTKLKTFGKLHRALALLLVISTFLPMIPSGIIPSFAVTGNDGVNNTIEHPEDYIGSTAEFAADSIKFFADGHQGSAEEGTGVFVYPKSKMPATVMIVDYMLVISEIDGKIGFFEISPIPGESFPEDFSKDNTWVYVSDLKIVKKNGDNYIFDENGNRADHTRIEWKNNSFNLTYTAKSTLLVEKVNYQWQIYCYGVNGTELSSNEYADMTDQNEKAEFEQLHKGWIDISGDKSPTINVNYGKIRSLLDPKNQVYIRCKTYDIDKTKTNYSSPITIELYTEESDNKQNTLSETGSYTIPAYLAGRLNNPVLSEPENGESDVKKTYNIVINYLFENNDIVSDPYTANLAEGSSFSQTVTFPQVQGYLPYVGETQQNSIELNYTSVSEDVTINVVYKPTNVNYTVIHYQQNVGDDHYTEFGRETKQGLTASQVPDVHKEYEGFYNLLYERPNIAADGSTVIEVYYDRYYCLINFDLDGGYGTDPVYARYGAPIGTVKNPTKAGYAFQGWADTEGDTTAVTLPTTMHYVETKTFYAIWKANETAKVTVVFWGENADDEKYSYLSEYTKEINRKPGDQFTYSEDGMLNCTKEDHTHGDDCIGCEKIEHTHTAYTQRDGCYELTCTTQSHTHGTNCYAGVGAQQNVYTNLPSNPQEGQVYNHWFYDDLIYIKGEWYKYSGTTASGSIAPTTCDLTETTHTHTNTCYNLTCTTEEHTHDKKCYICGKEEHTHGSSCYESGAGLDTSKWKFVKSDTITVAADGSSVVNVYYDRVEYSVQFYNGSGNSEYTDIKITAKWGAYIGDKWPTKNDSGTWAVNPSSNNNVSGPYQVYLQEMPIGGDKFYGPKTDIGTQSAYYYVDVLPGETGTETYNNKSYKLHHIDTSPGSGYVVTDDDKYAIQGFTFVGFTATQNNNGKYQYNDAKFYYTRNSYKLTFNDQYTNVKEESVNFEAPLSTYKDYVPEVPSQYEPDSVAFGGWYQNPQCTGEEYKLDEHKMPANDIILYAKWVPVERTVKFYLTESSTEVYKPSKKEPGEEVVEASFTVLHGDYIAEEYVKYYLEKSAMNEAKPNGDYTFVMWYYYENGEKKPFDPTTSIRKDLTLYGEWSSNTLKEYTVQYVLKSNPSVKVADDLTGSGLAGTTKTFVAKGGTELYAAYQEGYFPTVQSHSLKLDIDKENLTFIFEYVPMPAVPYTVKYVEKDTGKSLADDKVVSDNRKAVVTETFKPISGYMPDAYQKRLVVTADGENILYFYYTKDETHAYYKITHYIQNTDGTTWTEYASSQASGDIGTRYTASPLTIPGYTFKGTKYVVNGTEVTDVTAGGAKLTGDGLEINLYYVASEYHYQVRYLEQGTGKELADLKNGTGKYGQIISESAIDIDGYDKVDPTSANLTIRIDEGEGAPNLNIITFYYKEKEVTIKYVVAEGSGSVSPTTETVKVTSGTAHGSTPTPADGYKFVGWYKDEACTQSVDSSWVTDNKIVPKKIDGKNVAATYYAKFESDSTSLTIKKAFADGKKYDDNDVFVFRVTGNGVDLTVTIKGAGSVTINSLTVGETYTVTELSNWSWRYDQESVKFNGVDVTDRDGKVDLTADSNEIVFTNKLTKEKYLEGNASVDNIFDGEKITPKK